MLKIKPTLGIEFVNTAQEDVFEIDDTEWNDSETEDERGALIDEYCQD